MVKINREAKISRNDDGSYTIKASWLESSGDLEVTAPTLMEARQEFSNRAQELGAAGGSYSFSMSVSGKGNVGIEL